MESFIKAESNGKNICMVYIHNDDMVTGAILVTGNDVFGGIHQKLLDGLAKKAEAVES